jgi:hypothetical protein
MEALLQQDPASSDVTLTRICMRGAAYYMGWELSRKLLGGIDGDRAQPLLNRLRLPDGGAGWVIMTAQEWEAMRRATPAGFAEDLLPVLVRACCLRPLLEEVGLSAAVISALVDVPASPDETKVHTTRSC